jgi:RimJ/RimL family protein N-acetyltransferase
MPTPILTTERLTLRPITLFDAADIHASLNHPDVPGWLTNVPYPYTLADAEDFIRNTAQSPEGHHWAIDAGTGLIGIISVASELGYWLNADHHSKGYMSEAARAVVAWHFAHTESDLISGYHVANRPSANVLTKLGFENTHQEDQIKVATGKPVKTQRMVLTKDRWRCT